ncbi:MAG: four-carbon acid sugar kinase family protein [Vampirovibrionales bacterium]
MPFTSATLNSNDLPCWRHGIGLIADDLTGACDAALPFLNAGAGVWLYNQTLHQESTELRLPEASPQLSNAVLAINGASRHLDAPDILDHLKPICSALQQAGLERLYVKIDSTLRGPVGAFCHAIRHHWGADLAVVVPALPSNQRQTIGGYHLVNGLPVEQSEAGRDPRTPVVHSHISTVLKTSLPETLWPHIGHIELSTVLKGGGAVLAALLHEHQAGKTLISIDTATPSDLETIALALEKASHKLSLVPCGSAGLASVLSRRWVETPPHDSAFTSAETCSLPAISWQGACVGVMGSQTALSLEQLSLLDSVEGVERIPLRSELLLGLEPLDETLTRLQQCLVQGVVPVLTTAWPLSVVDQTLAIASEHQLPPQAVFYRLNHTLSQLAEKLTDWALRHELTQLTWWVSGGDTAEAIVNGMHPPTHSQHTLPLATWHVSMEPRTHLPTLAGVLTRTSSQGALQTLPIQVITRSGNAGTSTTLHAFLSRWLCETQGQCDLEPEMASST